MSIILSSDNSKLGDVESESSPPPLQQYFSIPLFGVNHSTSMIINEEMKPNHNSHSEVEIDYLAFDLSHHPYS